MVHLQEYYEFWDFVEKSGKPIYLHPREAEPSQFFKQFPEMRVSPWGFHVETAEHALRFILSGFFDRFPKIKLILGHDGEILIWMAWYCWHVCSAMQLAWTCGCFRWWPANGKLTVSNRKPIHFIYKLVIECNSLPAANSQNMLFSRAHCPAQPGV